MATWLFEPGHTEAEFRARHMMVTWVRGLFKDIHGRIELDWDNCVGATFEGEIDATGIWTGEPDRDEACIGEAHDGHARRMIDQAAVQTQLRPRPLA